MTLLEYYLNPGTAGINAGATFTALGATQWEYRFVGGMASATGSGTVTTKSILQFMTVSQSIFYNQISAASTTTTTLIVSQQLPAGNGNTYFSPMIGNILEQVNGIIANSAQVTGNWLLLIVDIDLDGDFDE